MRCQLFEMDGSEGVGSMDRRVWGAWIEGRGEHGLEGVGSMDRRVWEAWNAKNGPNAKNAKNARNAEMHKPFENTPNAINAQIM